MLKIAILIWVSWIYIAFPYPTTDTVHFKTGIGIWKTKVRHPENKVKRNKGKEKIVVSLFKKPFSNSLIFLSATKRLKMGNFFVKTTGVFSRVHPNLSKMLYCSEYKKDKVGLGHYFLLPLFSHVSIWGIKSCPTTPGAFCFQISLFSLYSVCIIRKSRLSSSSVKPCSWIAFPRRLIGVFKVSPQSCHHLYNYEILSPEQFQKITWPGILGEILHSIAAYLAKRDVVQHTNN